MELVDIVARGSFIMLFVTMGLAIVGKRRIDRNEPPFGWKRKQFLAEQKNGSLDGAKQTEQPKVNEKNFNPLKLWKERKMLSIRDLLEIKNIEYGIVERDKNEFCAVLGTDYVNFDLLQRSEQQAILEGYQQLFKSVNFDVQLFVLSERQDFRKEKRRFNENLKNCNPQTIKYNEGVIKSIEETTVEDFRITNKIYYVISYVYEPSKMAKLTREQKEKAIRNEIFLRLEIVRKALLRAKVTAHFNNTIETLNVFKQSLNRDRVLLHEIEEVATKEKTALYVTLDAASLPDVEGLIRDNLNDEEVNSIGA